MTRLEEIEARLAACPDGWDVAGVWTEWAEPMKADVRRLLIRTKALEKVAAAAFRWRDDSAVHPVRLVSEEDLMDAVDVYRLQYSEPE